MTSTPTMPRAAPTDALTTAFAKLARIENTNTNQIVVVDGQLCASRMADAVQAAARAFPLLGVRGGNPAGSGSASHGLSLHRWKGRCNFGDVGFRRMLMALSRDNRLDWPNRPAFQIYLILASDGLSSCVYLTSAHAVADARSDCLLLARLMREYARLSAPEGCAPDSDRKQGMPVHEFASLQDILPSWYGGVARMRRLASAGRSLAQDLVRGDQGLRRRRRPGVPPAELDFFHSTLEPEFADTIARNARRAGVTMNTLFLAALVRLMERSGKRATTRLTCAVSLRYSLDPAYGESFRNYLLPVAVRTARGLGDADLLGHLQSAVRAARRPASLQRELGRLESLAASISMPWLDPVSRFVIARSQGTNACLSNPGRIAEDLSGFGPQHPTRQYTGFGCLLEPYDFIFYPPTVNGRLQWDVVFRRAAFTDIEREFVAPYRDALLALIRGIAGNVAPTSAGGGATGAGGQS